MDSLRLFFNYLSNSLFSNAYAEPTPPIPAANSFTNPSLDNEKLDDEKNDNFWKSATIQAYCEKRMGDLNVDDSYCASSADPRDGKVPEACHIKEYIPQAEYFRRIGIGWLQQNRSDLAVQAFCDSLDNDSESAVSYSNFGMAIALELRGDNINEVLPIASEAFKTSAELNRYHSGPYEKMGELQIKAAGFLSKKLPLESENKVNRDEVEYSNKLYEAGIINFNSAIALSSSPEVRGRLYRSAAFAWLERAKIEKQLESPSDQKNCLNKAQADLKASLENNPNDPLSFYTLAESLSLIDELEESDLSIDSEKRKSRWGEIAKYYSAAFYASESPYSQSLESLYRLSVALEKSGSYPAAAQNYQKLFRWSNHKSDLPTNSPYRVLARDSLRRIRREMIISRSHYRRQVS